MNYFASYNVGLVIGESKNYNTFGHEKLQGPGFIDADVHMNFVRNLYSASPYGDTHQGQMTDMPTLPTHGNDPFKTNL